MSSFYFAAPALLASCVLTHAWMRQTFALVCSSSAGARTGSTVLGTLGALGVLIGLLIFFGPSVHDAPSHMSQLIASMFLLMLGMQWLWKAVLCWSELSAVSSSKARVHTERHDEFVEGAEPTRVQFSGRALIAFRTVLLTGAQIVLIALALGAASGSSIFVGIGTAIVCGLTPFVPSASGQRFRREEAQAVRFGAATVLTTFGLYWTAKHLGFNWPNDDGALIGLLWAVIMVALTAVGLCRVAVRETLQGKE